MAPKDSSVFDENHVDLVVLDYYMPDLNGGEVASEMRRRRPGVPIVLLSAYFSLPSEALEVADAFITKGDPPDVLIEKITEPALEGPKRLRDKEQRAHCSVPFSAGFKRS